MHGIHIADIRVAGIGAFHARGVSDHFPDARSRLFGRGGKLDVIVQALAHLFLAIDAKHLLDLGMLDLRLDQHLCVDSDN